eukprot:8837260-Heterocapsa_arctica.AAC.2
MSRVPDCGPRRTGPKIETRRRANPARRQAAPVWWAADSPPLRPLPPRPLLVPLPRPPPGREPAWSAPAMSLACLPPPSWPPPPPDPPPGPPRSS